jgi:hypothetical protein
MVYAVRGEVEVPVKLWRPESLGISDWLNLGNKSESALNPGLRPERSA